MGSRTVYAGWQPDTMRFADVSPDKWYGEAIRAQTAAMLHRFCEDVLK